MTAAAADLDGDGWVDLYVACDSTAAIFYRNNQRRHLHRPRPAGGPATASTATPRRAWALAVGDYDGDGRLDLLKTHFADDIPALYRNLGRGPVRGRGHRGRPGRAQPVRRVGGRAARPRQRRPARTSCT